MLLNIGSKKISSGEFPLVKFPPGEFPPDEFPPGELPPGDFPLLELYPRKSLPGKNWTEITNPQK